jgi:cupin 2 domain-containing protein
VIRGRLHDASSAPSHGERVEEVLQLRTLAVRQILSGGLDGPVDYRQDEDEWVVVLAGAAVLEVDGERVDLAGGDWVLLPAGTPHRLVHTEPGTNWLTVHLARG